MIVPSTGDFLFARGKAWIVEKVEQTASVQTMHLVSREDDSQGESLQLAASKKRAHARHV